MAYWLLHKGNIMELEEFKTILKKKLKLQESDLSDRPEDLLNGNIILILGNHDPKAKQFINRDINPINGFYYEDKNGYVNKIYNPIPDDRMLSGIIKEIKGKKCLFAHYPVFDNDDWDRQNKRIAPRIDVLENIFLDHECEINVHGHVHSNKSAFENAVNVCFEHTGFRPQRLGELL
jgi:calcineurin-like phosphoesterase family protein